MATPTSFNVDLSTGSSCTNGKYTPNSSYAMSNRDSTSCQKAKHTHCGDGEWYWGTNECSAWRKKARCRSIPSDSTVCDVLTPAPSTACPTHYFDVGGTTYEQPGTGDCSGSDISPSVVKTGQTFEQCAELCNTLGSQCQGFSYSPTDQGGRCAPKTTACGEGKNNQSNGYIKYDKKTSGPVVTKPSSKQWKGGLNAMGSLHSSGDITCGFDYAQFDTPAKAAAFLTRFGDAAKAEYDTMMFNFCTRRKTASDPGECPKCNEGADCPTTACTNLAASTECRTWLSSLPQSTPDSASGYTQDNVVDAICSSTDPDNANLVECSCVNRSERNDYRAALKARDGLDALARESPDHCWWTPCKESNMPMPPYKLSSFIEDAKATCSNSICINTLQSGQMSTAKNITQECNQTRTTTKPSSNVEPPYTDDSTTGSISPTTGSTTGSISPTTGTGGARMLSMLSNNGDAGVVFCVCVGLVVIVSIFLFRRRQSHTASGEI